MKRRALLSVSDKSGIVDFAIGLAGLGFEIVSTGGTCDTLSAAGVDVIPVEDITGFAECLDGRLKTLHPKVHGGLLVVRENPLHMLQISELGIKPIDLVAVNLYPFKDQNSIENIDIGGPAMLRAAAKNYRYVTPVVDPDDYGKVLAELEATGKVSDQTNLLLACKVFAHTAAYDSAVAAYLEKTTGALPNPFPASLTITYEKAADLRYGENPHQKAALYRHIGTTGAEQLHGKELSFNNINDVSGALELLREFDEPTVVACKHSVPCGVGSGVNITEAYHKAYLSDPVSIFGGIVCANHEIDSTLAAIMHKTFLEVILAPSYTPEALDILTGKKNIRLLRLDVTKPSNAAFDIRNVYDGLLIQQANHTLLLPEPMKFVTKRRPTDKEMEDLLFCWKVVKHVKSNGIVIGKSKQTLGIGTGQTSRIRAVCQAIEQAGQQFDNSVLQGSVMASDAFFPFPDCVEAAAKVGILAIIHPGGSVNDQESINICNDLGIAMVFTGIRHFRH
ncbi:MAG: bifunctional phosphoribosylaminoimidazolecarboxamide formyltransferase/IMP cyclohydrolase [Defluviitaleaceae bacterium]|nr:bifunctional phosphoribosylaminoimidazolecarboxamide formyltransferase/IMP cyclohydrolase [Defluviitaleaceae bacterium]